MGTEHVRWLAEPNLNRPVLVAAFTGWNDAGDSASMALRTMIEAWGAEALAEIDPEAFTDFATVRPHVRLDDLQHRSIIWPTVGVWSVSLPGTDVILVLGPEPALRWRLFCDQVVGIAEAFGATMAVSLGALLADVPHSRAVPGYASQIPAPVANLAGDAAAYDAQVAAMIGDDDDMIEYLSRLERMTDDEAADDDLSSAAPLDSDALVEEVEQFLRNRDPDRTESNVAGDSTPSIASKAMGPHHCTPAVTSGSASDANQPTSAVSSGCGVSSPPVARQWKSSMYIPNRLNPIRWPSTTPSRRRGSHSIPVSSFTSFTATSAGE